MSAIFLSSAFFLSSRSFASVSFSSFSFSACFFFLLSLGGRILSEVDFNIQVIQHIFPLRKSRRVACIVCRRCLEIATGGQIKQRLTQLVSKHLVHPGSRSTDISGQLDAALAHS